MALREVLAEFGYKIDSAPLEKANALIDTSVKSLGNLKGVVAGALAGLGLGVFKEQVDEVVEQSENIHKSAIKAGLGFEEFQKLQYQTGLSTESLTMLFRKLQQNMAAAAGEADKAGSDFADIDGGLGRILNKKQAGDTFKQLGIHMTGAGGAAKTSAQIFQETVAALSKLHTNEEKVALATRLFGKSGQDILPFLNKTPEQLAELSEQFEMFGGISEETAAKLHSYHEQTRAMTLASNALKYAIVSLLVPAFTWLYQKLNEGATWIKKNVDTSDLLVIAFGVLTAAVVTYNGAAIAAAARTALAWGAVLLPIALLILFVDDLAHFLKGDAHTAIESVINSLFGLKDGAAIVKELRGDFKEWIDDLRAAPGIIEKIIVVLRGLSTAQEKTAEIYGTAVVSKVTGANPTSVRDAIRTKPTEEISGYGDAVLQGAKEAAKNLALGPLGLFRQISQTYGQGKVAFGGGKEAGPTTQTVNQTVNVTQNVTGSDAQNIADNAKDGLGKTTGEQTRAALAAVRVTK